MTTPNRPEDAENLGGNFAALGALDDPLAADAIELVVKEQQASVSFLQRKMGIGYGRAARIIDAMKEDGIIGPQTAPNVARTVYMKNVPANLRDLIDQAAEAQPAESVPSVEDMPSVFTPDAYATGENDSKFSDATNWIIGKEKVALTDLAQNLGISIPRAKEIVNAMGEKGLVKSYGFMPFPNFFEVVPAPTPDSTTAAPSRSSDPFAPTPMLDTNGGEWKGSFDTNLSGQGKVVRASGIIEEGTFQTSFLVEGKRIRTDGVIMEGVFSRESGMLLSGTITESWKITKGDFKPEDGSLMNGTIKYTDDGSVRRIVDGVIANQSSPISTAPNPSFDAYVEPIRSIRENAIFGRVFKTKQAEAMKGVERIEELVRRLSDEDQRLIGELYIKFIDRTPPAPSGLGKLFTKKTTKETPWRALDTNVGEGNTVVEIDPLRLPADDAEIAQYLITVAKKYANQRRAEMAVYDLREATQVFGLELDYDHGAPNFLASLPGIEKIKNAMMRMDEEETGLLSRSSMLLLMAGQKQEEYVGGKYRIILSCDTTMSEDQIAAFLRGELARIEKEDASPLPVARRAPTKKSAPGIFSSTRGKIAGALAALAVVGAGAAVVHQNNKPVPVDTTPAPKAPKAPKAPEKAAEPPKAPEEAAEAPKAPEAPKKESGEIKKVDLSKIPVGGKVTFKTYEDGVKMGVLVRDGPDYVAVDKFEFVNDGSNAVERLKK